MAVASAGATSISGSSGLTVVVSPNGTYEVSIPYPAWHFAGSVGVAVQNLSARSGTDAAGGAYNEISFDFFTDAPRHASIRCYYGSQAVLFTLSLPSGGSNTLSFPSLTTYPRGLNHIAYAGMFAYPTFYGSSEESPWIYFDSSFHTVILSPATHFMVASTGTNGQALASGISTKIASLPAGFTQQTLLVVGNGINQTFDQWGALLTGLTGKTRPSNDADVMLSRLGYWTDAGSSYYYAVDPGFSYPDTLAAVKAQVAASGTALGYLQLDSWFYPKGGSADWLSRSGGIYEYQAASPPFASSLSAFQRAIGLPLITHARWIDPQSPYRQQYVMSGNVSIDPRYWSFVSTFLANSGVVGFEQDWLSDMATAAFNLTDEDAFLDNMAGAMGQQNITIQYCSGTARHFLQSARYNNLTTIRASMDRFDQTRWTNFLYASRLASAVGIWPFTDVLMSGETGNLLLATLSAGPVGIGDRVEMINGDNLRRVARADGVIVKPDVPLTPIDSSFWGDSNNALAPMVAATYTDYGQSRAWYLFSFAQGDNMTATFRLSDAGVLQPTYLYDYFAGTGRVVDPSELLTVDATGFRYLVAAPLGVSGMALLGDTGHFVTLGKKRITDVVDDGTLRVRVVFAAGETARTLQGYSPDAPGATGGDLSYDASTGLFSVVVTPGADGTAQVQISRTVPTDAPAPVAGCDTCDSWGRARRR
jgi:hypothetical protein